MSKKFDDFCKIKNLYPLTSEDLEELFRKEYDNSLNNFHSLSNLHSKFLNPDIDVTVGFLWDYSFNARAFFTPDDVIAINWGVIDKLIPLFSLAIKSTPMRWIPTELRMQTIHWMVELGKNYIFLHELGHVWNGHTRLGNDRGLNVIDEREKADGRLSGLDRQTLEMDADGFAISGLFSQVYGLNKPFPCQEPYTRERFGEGATSLLMMSMALYMIFQLVQKDINWTQQDNWTHPPAPLRQYLAAGSFATVGARLNLFDAVTARSVAIGGMVFADEAFAEISGNAPANGAPEVFRGMGETYMAQLLKHWHVLYPQLDKLKPGGSLSVPQEIPDRWR